jgi:hypothetical protein
MIGRLQGEEAQMVQDTRWQAIGEEAWAFLAQFFEYDRDVPLNGRVLDRKETESAMREKVVFRGLRQSRIPGYLTVRARSSSPFPWLLLAHGMVVQWTIE